MRSLSHLFRIPLFSKSKSSISRIKFPDLDPPKNPKNSTPTNLNSNEIDSVRQKWDELSDMYSTLDASPQTFFFTLLNLLKIRKASNILEIACGGGLLLPFVIDQKQQSAQYVATDLSDTMIKRTYSRLQSHFKKYKSTLTLEQWLKEQNMVIKQADGEQPIQGFQPFDTVICNLVLMLTINPKSILESAYKVTSKNANMGITIWGNRQNSNFLTLYSKAIKSLNLPIANPASPFDYQQKIKSDLKQTGWKIKFEWQQNSPFHYSGEIQQVDNYLSSVYRGDEEYSKQDLTKIKTRMRELYLDIIANRTPLQMSTKMFIVQK